MDKIQELHGKVYLNNLEIMDAIRDHAAITEDMMGRFAEWVEKSGYHAFTVYDEYGRIKPSWSNVPNVYKSISELIQLFKEKL